MEDDDKETSGTSQGGQGGNQGGGGQGGQGGGRYEPEVGLREGDQGDTKRGG